MTKVINSDQVQQRVEALQKEAVRLATNAKVQLDDYARTLDLSKQTKVAQAMVETSRDQLQQSSAHASAQVVAAMASAFEDAAGQLRAHSGANGPVARVVNQAASTLEQGSEYLQPWRASSMLRRFVRLVRHYPLGASVVALISIGVAYVASRNRLAAS